VGGGEKGDEPTSETREEKKRRESLSDEGVPRRIRFGKKGEGREIPLFNLTFGKKGEREYVNVGDDQGRRGREKFSFVLGERFYTGRKEKVWLKKEGGGVSSSSFREKEEEKKSQLFPCRFGGGRSGPSRAYDRKGGRKKGRGEGDQ